MMLRGEYRWAVHKMADVAGFVEGGKVASTVKGLGLRNMAEAVGIGLRVHTKTSSLVDLDLAHGRDGFKFSIGFTTGGS
jgi:hemolysin activation/secretion protein